MKKVLIVDDSKFIRVLLSKILNGNGFDVVGEAESGLMAINKIAELNPDIVTLDIIMPGYDGIKTLKIIKEKYPDVVVIMITAINQNEYVKKAYELGAEGIIFKPFSEQEVLSSFKSFNSSSN